MREPTVLEPRRKEEPPLVFRHGAHWPFAVRWFGISSLFGNARSLIASAIASEQIDSRDWMRPQTADELLKDILSVLGGDAAAATLVEGLARPLWIDFVADTGDDRDVSEAVGRMIFAEYRLSSGDVLPRGEVLMFGGDTAYPVATADEIHRRVIAPWNEVLREVAPDGKRRVLIGVPGNHDWYDGLDGFARLFRRGLRVGQSASEPPDPASIAAPKREGGRKTGFFMRQLHLDEIEDSIGLLASLGRSLRALAQGKTVKHRKRLSLDGYEAVQESSYWTLPLAPELDVYGVDRQLGRVDFRQRTFFQQRRAASPDARVLFVAPDPALAYGDPWEKGAQMLESCKLDFERDEVFYLTGDIHHYERREVGRSLHVIAGGGGAFLCGTRIPPSPAGPAAAAYPSAAVSRRLLWQVPLRMMLGRGGFLAHWGFVLIAFVELAASLRGTTLLVIVAVLVSLVMTFACYVNAGHHGARTQPRKVLAIALLYGVGFGLLPMGLRLGLPQIIPELAEDGAIIAIYAFLGALGFGFFCVTLALFGLHSQQAYVVLSHPGFKHFVRLCVHPTGRIDAYTIGKDDPLGDAPATLVDRFTWQRRAPESGRSGKGREAIG